MKRTFIILVSFAALVSCSKEIDDVKVPNQIADDGEIVIMLEDGSMDIDVTTKTTAVSSIPSSLYFAGTTGTGTSQTNKWSSTSKTVSSGKITTGYYQTATATAYNYYLSNLAMTFAASGCTITADGTSIDAIVGVTKASTSTTPSVTLNHIFARTGSISCSSSNGYTLSNVTYKLKSKGSTTGTKGTYNIYNDSWSSVTALSETAITSSSDLYLIPGVYTITVSGTEKLGDFSHTFTGSADITLAAGKQNNITISRSSSGAQGITVSVSLTAWGTNSVSATI